MELTEDLGLDNPVYAALWPAVLLSASSRRIASGTASSL
jgi:hypothetical protein